MGNLGFYFDMQRCIGCRTCQIACKDRNDLEAGTVYRRVVSFETGTYPSVSSFNYSASCNHCAQPQCTKVCPTGAMHKADDGTVQHDPNICIGCQFCAMACPYGVPRFRTDRGVVGKCDSCADLRADGEQPACVAACLMRCLDFGDLDELAEKHGDEYVADLPVLPDSNLTAPSLMIKPRACALSEDPRTCLV